MLGWWFNSTHSHQVRAGDVTDSIEVLQTSREGLTPSQSTKSRRSSMASERSSSKRYEFNWLCTKSLGRALLCAISVSAVSLGLMNSEQKLTTESQRTQRLHRELSEQVLFVQSRFNSRRRSQIFLWRSQVVRHRTVNAVIEGSNPSATARSLPIVDCQLPIGFRLQPDLSAPTQIGNWQSTIGNVLARSSSDRAAAF